MIRFQVVSVVQHKSAEVRTIHLTTIDANGKPKEETGAKWEVIGLRFAPEEKQPKIQVGNLIGNYYIASAIDARPLEITILDPNLFGLYQVGDFLNLAHEDK